MSALIVSPVLVPFVAAILCLLTRRSRRIQRVTNLVGAVALALCGGGLVALVTTSGVQSVQIGGWDAPVGVSFVVDRLSAGMVLITGIVALAIALYSVPMIDKRRELFGYYAMVNTLLMGVCGAFLTGDIFNLYVWFEVMLMSSFVLLALGGERPQLEGSIKYVTLNLLSSAIFLSAIGILYGLVGTLNMADLAVRVVQLDDSAKGMVSTLAVMFLVAFGIKAGVFPLFFWLPASYHTPPAPISALFAALLTKVGLYVILRVFTLIFVLDVPTTHTLILAAAGSSLIVGGLGAIAQNVLRRQLSFLIISSIGFALIGPGLMIGLGDRAYVDASAEVQAVVLLGLAGSIFYLFHTVLVKASLFILAGSIERWKGTDEIGRLGGLALERPWLSVMWAIAAFSLAGVPPLSGVFPKLALIGASFRGEHYGIAIVALVCSVLVLYAIARVWLEVFWKPSPDGEGGASERSRATASPAPAIVLSILIVAMGLGAGPVFSYCREAALGLLDPSDYIERVGVLDPGLDETEAQP